MSFNRPIVFQNPKTFVFGPNSLKQLESDFLKLGYKNLYILTVSSVLEQLLPSIDTLKNSGIKVKINVNISAEPTFNDFHQILAEAKEFKADSVIGIGGGSVMDLAKIVAVFIDTPQKLDDVVGIGLITGRKTWMACMPTTSGTGSEVSPNSILLDERDNAKKGIISPYLVPDGAYVDPALTLSVPPAITAFTGIDALTHCIEAYANKFAHPAADTYALQGIRLISQNLKQAFKNGNNLEARSNVALGSVYGGMCLGPVNTGAVHALAYPLGTYFKVAHGLSNAVMLPYVLEFNLESAVDRYAHIALALGAPKGKTELETAQNGITFLRELLQSVEIPGKMAQLGVKTGDIEKMAGDAIKIQRLLKNNVREVTFSDAVVIYNNAL